MANFSGVDSSNATNIPSTEGNKANVLNVPSVTCITTIIINGIICPFTVLLNVLVIMAVKRRPRLQTKSNILLACLAATDAFTGLIVQPSFIVTKISLLLDSGNHESRILDFHSASLYIAAYSSLLHLTFVTLERVVAIKFTMRYLNVITWKNIKIAVTVFWIIAFISGFFRMIRMQLEAGAYIISFLVNLCMLFVVFCYVILYRETRRIQKKIKTQQLPQEEVERFSKENKALKTTVFVVCAIFFCILPSGIFLVLMIAKLITSLSSGVILQTWVRTFGMLNSLFNPLIYCWRQKEMRKYVFRMRNQVLHPANQKNG